MIRRPWTRPELEQVQFRYGTETAATIGAAMDRSERSVFQAAQRLGLTRSRPASRPGYADFIRSKHAEGWSDAEIAKAWGSERHSVGRQRKLMGLADNTFSSHRIERVRAKTREQCEKAGVASLGQVRAKAFRERARKAGWPEDLRPRAVQILNTLWDRGPMNRREIADAIGMPWKGSRKSLVSNDPEGSYLAHLMARGLVICLGRVNRITGMGRGKSTFVYSLPTWINRGQFNETEPNQHTTAV